MAEDYTMSAAPVKKVPIHLQSSQNRLLIKGGKIVNAHETLDADVFIEDGQVKEIGTNLIIPGGTRVINASGLLLIPGGVDASTHLEVELLGKTSTDDFYQGTKAAIAGGTTTIIDYVLPDKGESLLDAYNKWRQRADNKVCCDYALHVGLPGWSNQVSSDMEHLCEQGVNSFKVSMANVDLSLLDDGELYQCFNKCKELGALPMVHAENGHLIAETTKQCLEEGKSGPEAYILSRGPEVEAEAINRACVIANMINCPLYIDGVTSKAGCDVLNRHREQNDRIFGSSMVSSIGLDAYSSACATVTAPPLKPDTSLHIIQQLASGYIALVASDHCTFNAKDKSEDFFADPVGTNGLEDRMAVVWEKTVETGALTMNQFVAITSANPAKIFNIFPRKGCIRVGSDADIVVWNPRKSRQISASNHLHNCDTNIFEGMQVHGAAEYVVVNGRVCVDEGVVKVVQGFGRFVATPPSAPFLYGTPEEISNLTETNKDVSDTQSNASTGNSDVFSANHAANFFDDPAANNRHTGRAQRPDGQRNLQDSTFSISSDGDDFVHRSSIRVKNPPGGKSSGGFW